jgi:hypothetical protein
MPFPFFRATLPFSSVVLFYFILLSVIVMIGWEAPLLSVFLSVEIWDRRAHDMRNVLHACARGRSGSTMLPNWLTAVPTLQFVSYPLSSPSVFDSYAGGVSWEGILFFGLAAPGSPCLFFRVYFILFWFSSSSALRAAHMPSDFYVFGPRRNPVADVGPMLASWVRHRFHGMPLHSFSDFFVRVSFHAGY